MAKKENKATKKGKALFAEFKAFISKGNAFNLAIGVVIGGAFTAIVNALVGILTSLATWPLPGGLAGLVTPLPALTAAQEGIPGIGQHFSAAADSLVEATKAFALTQGVTTVPGDAVFMQYQTALLSKYTLYGTEYYYNMTAIINWGALINAIISFLIIAIVLFVVVKVVATANAAAAKAKAKLQEEYWTKHPEERPVPVEPGAPAPTELDVLNQILAEMKKTNEKK